MTFDKYTYAVTDKKEDYKETVIEKSGITVPFTLGALETSITDMEKTLKELRAKYNHEKIIKENIEQHHPFVLDLTPEQKHTVYMYLEACEVVKQYEPKIAEFDEALQSDKAELEYVKTTVLNA